MEDAGNTMCLRGGRPMKFAYADPPYLGCCRLYDRLAESLAEVSQTWPEKTLPSDGKTTRKAQSNGDTGQRRGPQGDLEHSDGDGEFSGEATLSEVSAQVSVAVGERRNDVRLLLPLGGLRIRADDHPVTAYLTPPGVGETS